MITDNQEFEPPTDWPHLALSVHSHGEEETNDLPTEEEHVDEICAQVPTFMFLPLTLTQPRKKPEYVVLQYTTIDIENVPESLKETIEAIEYQEKWEKDVEGWFKKRNFEPTGHKTLDSEPVSNCELGIERFAAYGRVDHAQYAWYMRRELRGSTATLSRHHWVFELSTFCMVCDRHFHPAQQHNCTFCMACDRHFHPAQQHDCNRKCTFKEGATQCAKTFHGDLNLKRHQTFHYGYTLRKNDWCGQEVRVAYNLHLLGYNVDDISKEIPWRSEIVLGNFLKNPVYGCRVCHGIFPRRSLLETHSRKEHEEIPTQYYCYKCSNVHELRGWRACLGKQRKLDLGDRAEMNTFYEMQLRFLAQYDGSGRLELTLMADAAHMERSEFLYALCEYLSSKVLLWSITPTVDKLKRKMLAHLLKVVRCEEKFISQGKGDRVINVSSGNLEWYRKLRSKARDGDERLSATEMGLDTRL